MTFFTIIMHLLLHLMILIHPCRIKVFIYKKTITVTLNLWMVLYLKSAIKFLKIVLKSISSQLLLSDHLSSTDPCSAPHQQDCQRKPGCVLRDLGVPAVRHGHPTEGDQRCVWGPQRCVSQAVQSCYQFVGWLLGLQTQTTSFFNPRYERPLYMYDICIYHSTYHNIVIWI